MNTRESSLKDMTIELLLFNYTSMDMTAAIRSVSHLFSFQVEINNETELHLSLLTTYGLVHCISSLSFNSSRLYENVNVRGCETHVSICRLSPNAKHKKFSYRWKGDRCDGPGSLGCMTTTLQD